jgi:chromosome segregation ATPase
MYRNVFISILLLLFVLSGCKSQNSANSSEQTARLDKLAGDIDSASKTLDDMRIDLASRIAKIDGDIAAMKQMLEKGAKTKTATATSGEMASAGTADLADNLETLNSSIAAISASLGSFAEELTSLRGDMQNLASANRDVSQQAERRKNFEEMGDPKKLAAKLDDFTKKYSEKLLATGKSGEFETDMAALRDSVGKEYSTAELAQKYKTDLEKRIAETTDERIKGFFQNQLNSLQTAQGDQLTEQLQNYQRFSNMQQINAIVEKYQIPRNELSDAGIMTFGGRGGFGGGPGGGNRGNRGNRGGGGTGGGGGGTQ